MGLNVNHEDLQNGEAKKPVNTPLNKRDTKGSLSRQSMPVTSNIIDGEIPQSPKSPTAHPNKSRVSTTTMEKSRISTNMPVDTKDGRPNTSTQFSKQDKSLLHDRASLSPQKRKSNIRSSVSIIEESAKQDIIDPVYKEKDPISASLKLR